MHLKTTSQLPVGRPFAKAGAISFSARNPLSALVVSLAAVLIIGGICSLLYQREANEIKRNTLDREARRTEIYSHLIQEDLLSVIKDLRHLADGDGLQAFLLTGQQADLDRAIHRAWFFSQENPDYDQVRFLDENGKEIIRVNQGGVIVSANQLQNKADRPYFKKALSLARDQFYISAFDLNIENGRIEQPLKPMVRVATPIFDSTGRKRGIVIINDLAANIVARLQNFAPQYQQRLRVLNAQGYWIKSDQPDREWGFMFPDRAGMTLAQKDPELWTQVSHEAEGQVPHAGGIFTWHRFVPGAIVSNPSNILVADDSFLVVASELSAQEWDAPFKSLRETFLIVGLVLLLLLALSWSFFHSRQRAQQERDRFFILTRDMLCVAGFDGYFRRINPAWEALGYSSGELLSKPFVEFVHPDDVEKTQAVYKELTQGKEIISFENRYRCKDGSYRWLSWSARTLSGDQLIFASARDLTERKRMEETLRQNEERSRSIIERALDAFISIDAEGHITDWNLQAESIFGWTRAEALGRFLHETIIPPSFREGHLRGIRHLQATGEGPVLNKRIELPALRRDGSEFPVEIAIWPLSTGGKPTFHAFVSDITKRKEAEARIQKLNEEMKHRADQLEASNKELEAFSYSVSHDLRAPLRHIHGFIELLEESPVLQADPSSVRQMGVIAGAAKKMSLLIDDLLAFSRTGRAQIHAKKIDTREMIDQVIQELAPEIQDRTVTWQIAPLPKVTGDPALLWLVWTNLLSNALKYSRPRAETKIEIGCTDRATADAPEVIFHVRDNGVGFDMQYASKLFGVFQRLHPAEDFEGTGIGLANVQRIIYRHGGRVWAESTPDAGATFYFSLPVIPSQD